MKTKSVFQAICDRSTFFSTQCSPYYDLLETSSFGHKVGPFQL